MREDMSVVDVTEEDADDRTNIHVDGMTAVATPGERSRKTKND